MMTHKPWHNMMWLPRLQYKLHLMKTTGLFLLVAVLVGLTGRAQSSFFGRELVVNGDASQGTTGWTPLSGSGWTSGGVEVHTYSQAGLSNNLPSGKSATDHLFTGQFDQGFLGNFSNRNTASQQIVTVPADAYTAVDAGQAYARASALLGGVSDQDDNATLIFTFNDAGGTALGSMTLGPVMAADRGEVSGLLERSATLQIPAGTRSISIHLEMREASLGDNTNGYATDISLVAGLTPVVSTDKNTYENGQTVTVTYENAMQGSTVEVYKYLSALPMKWPENVGNQLFNSGSTVFGLEPGRYQACIVVDGTKMATSAPFEVKPRELTPGKRFVILSDIHVMAPSLVRRGGSAIDGQADSDLRLIKESDDILSALTDRVLAIHPDYVLVTGDMTKDGERESHELVISYLKKMKDAGIQVFVIPGNHDCNNPNARVYDGSGTDYAQAITRDEFRELYHDFGYGHGIRHDPNSLSYICQIDDKLVLLGIDSNRDEENTCVNWGAESNHYVNSGRVKEETLMWMEEQLQQVKEGNRAAVAMIHHHMVPHFDREKTLIGSYIIDDYEQVQQLLLAYGVHLVLSGHLHVSDISCNGGGVTVSRRAPARAAAVDEQQVTVGDNTMIEISTGSGISYPLHYREMTINAANTVVDVATHSLTELNGYDDIYATAQQHVVDNLSSLLNTVSAKAYDILMQKIDERAGALGSAAVALAKSMVTLDVVKQNVQTYMGEAAAKAYTTFGECNESSKYTDGLRQEIEQSVYDMVYNTLPSLLQGFTDTLVESVYPEVEPILTSMLDDTNNVGTANECQVDDLFNTVILPLKIPTDVVDSPASLMVDHVVYYDLTGHSSSTPLQGVNIVVTTYADGTQSAEKIIN